MKTMPYKRRVLYVALFLHDIAKGRPRTTRSPGARRSRGASCPRFGLEPAETELVAWLVEEHLTMSMIAQSRDLADPKTIRDFAADRADAGAAEAPARSSPSPTSEASAPASGTAGRASSCARSTTRPSRCCSAATASSSASSGSQRRKAELAPSPRRWPEADRRAISTGTIPPTGCGSTSPASSSTRALLRRADVPRHRIWRPPSPPTRFRGGDRAHRGRARPSAPARDPRRRLHRRGRQHRRRADLHHHRRLRARHHLPVSREFPEDQDELRRAERIARLDRGGRWTGDERLPEIVAERTGAKKPRKGLHVLEPEVLIDNSLVGAKLHRDGGVRPRPAGPALRADDGDLGPQPQHRLGPYRDLRRAGRRRVLRHRPHPADRSSRPAGSAACARRCSTCSVRRRKRRDQVLVPIEAATSETLVPSPVRERVGPRPPSPQP
jgi:[protein-PII] uridylyltransferase